MEEIYNIGIYSLVIFFLISSISKIINLSYFINIVIEFEFLPKNISKLFGALLPFIELIAAISLVVEGKSIFGMITLILLLFCFGISVLKIISTEKDISCGCYGKFLDSNVDKFTFIKIIFLMFLTVILLINSGSYVTNFSISYLIIGLLSTSGFLLLQKLISFHQKAIAKINVYGVD